MYFYYTEENIWNIFPRPTMLMILDGYGINDDSYGNAVAAADTPFPRRHIFQYPSTRLDACGLAVGLPKARWETLRWDTLT